MNNVENQKRLDRKKYFKSLEFGEDQSGKMDYCKVCEFSKNNHCPIGQTSRELSTLCATAYNRMVRKNRERETR